MVPFKSDGNMGRNDRLVWLNSHGRKRKMSRHAHIIRAMVRLDSGRADARDVEWQ